jgi:hypothetical protein
VADALADLNSPAPCPAYIEYRKMIKKVFD